MPKNQKTHLTGFEQFGLHEALVRGIRDLGFTSPRPIQAETIPAGLDGVDVLGLAQTGTGKTAAFALTLLDWILRERKRGIQALVLVPTRELANQIASEIELLAQFTRVKLAVIYGGVPQHRQVSRLRGRCEIVVGCPGRVLDLIEQRLLDVRTIECVVLDEADQMFDMGFMPTVHRILARIPAKRQNLLFSATMPREVRRLADEMLHEPHVVELATHAPVETIDHGLVMVAEQNKRDLLKYLLGRSDCHSAIVFTRTKQRAKRLAAQLSKVGHRAVDLQGNLSQAQRDRAMRGFRSRRYDILVATDIAARGIDVSGVSHVINFDAPSTPEQYTHRIGRTGRAELTGIARTFVTSQDHEWLRSTERMIGESIRRETIDGFEADTSEARVKPVRGSTGGTRRNRRQGGGNRHGRYAR